MYAGNKVLANTGELYLHGHPKVSHSKLVFNSFPGENFIFVEGVDWVFGD